MSDERLWKELHTHANELTTIAHRASPEDKAHLLRIARSLRTLLQWDLLQQAAAANPFNRYNDWDQPGAIDVQCNPTENQHGGRCPDCGHCACAQVEGMGCALCLKEPDDFLDDIGSPSWEAFYGELLDKKEDE